jgi:hypothetical protein
MTYLKEFEAELVKRIAYSDFDSFIRWVSEKLLESYRNGITAGQKGAQVIRKGKSRRSGPYGQEELLSKKKRLQEIINKNENGQMAWIEPFRRWVNTAKTLGETARCGSPQDKKGVASKVFGSNLFLDNKKVRGCSIKPWSFLAENSSHRMVEPMAGIEPATDGLRNRCSTTELHWLKRY